MAVWSQLVDVRFRLLALVPTLTAAGVGLLGNSANLGSYRVTLVAALGLVSVVAIMIYDLRNSMLHDFAVHRLKRIEVELQLERTVRDYKQREDDNWNSHPSVLTETEAEGGVFTERPPSANSLLGVRVQHDHALAIIYVASVGAWATLVSYSALKRSFDLSATAVGWSTVGIAAAVVFAVAFGVHRYNIRHSYLLHVLTGGRPNEPWEAWNKHAPPSRNRIKHLLDEHANARTNKLVEAADAYGEQRRFKEAESN